MWGMAPLYPDWVGGDERMVSRGHTIGPMFANSLRIHMVFPKTYFDLKVDTESLQELTKSLRIWCYFHCFGLRFEFREISVYAYNF